MQRFFVYVFVNHNTGNPVYIGKGSRNREIQHRSDASCGKDGRLYRWMRKYKALNNVWPKLFKLAEGLTEQEAFDFEKALIAFYGRADLKTGCLFNHTNGGDGVSGYSFPREIVDRLVEKKRGKKLSSESIAKRTASVLGRKNSPETILKMRMAALKRKPMSSETRAKISLAGRGRKASAETLMKLSASRKGKPSGNKGHKGYTISEEGRANISAAKKISGASLEFRAKMSAIRKGKKLSAEHRQKLSLAQNRRYERARQLLAA